MQELNLATLVRCHAAIACFPPPLLSHVGTAATAVTCRMQFDPFEQHMGNLSAATAVTCQMSHQLPPRHSQHILDFLFQNPVDFVVHENKEGVAEPEPS